MDWWITQAGITQGPASLAGNPLYVGPYTTRAAARAAFQAGVRPGSAQGAGPSGGGQGGGSQWWVVFTGSNARGNVYAVKQAAAKPASEAAGPFSSQGAAQAWITSQSAVHLPDPLHGIDAVGAFFTKLGDRATWVRILKVAVGAIMIIAGLARIGAPAAEKIAAKLPKVIPV